MLQPASRIAASTFVAIRQSALGQSNTDKGICGNRRVLELINRFPRKKKIAIPGRQSVHCRIRMHLFDSSTPPPPPRTRQRGKKKTEQKEAQSLRFTICAPNACCIATSCIWCCASISVIVADPISSFFIYTNAETRRIGEK